MSRRNVTNSTSTSGEISSQKIDIQGSGAVLSITGTSNNGSSFTFDPDNNLAYFNSDLIVNGDITYNTIISNQVTGGMMFLANDNAADLIDIGMNGKYNGATYTGIIRQASDPLRRWTFFDNVGTLPTSTVSDINVNTLASTRMNRIYVNNGSDVNPSVVFDQNGNHDTGFYSTGNDIGVTIGGVPSVYFRTTGIDFVNNSVINIGASGTSCVVENYGKLHNYGTGSFTGVGNILPASSSLYIAPISTNLTNDNYYFTYFAQPITNGTSTESAYTVYIEDAPLGSASSYALFVANGTTGLRDLAVSGFMTLNNPLAVNYGGTGVTTSTGSGSNVLSNSPNLVTPNIGDAVGSSFTTGPCFQNGNGWTYYGSGDTITNYSYQDMNDKYNIFAWYNTSSGNNVYVGQGSSSFGGTTDAAVVITTGPNILLCPNNTAEFVVKSGGEIQLPNFYQNVSVLKTDTNGNIRGASTTGSGDVVLATGPTLVMPNIGVATGSILELNTALTVTNTATANINGNITIGAGFNTNIIVSSASSITLLSSNNIIESAYEGNVIVTLPDLTLNIGRSYTIIKTSVAGFITINTNGIQTIDDGIITSITLNDTYDRVMFIGGTSQWYTM